VPTGVHGYLVTSTITYGGGSGPLPASQTFTVVLDAGAQQALIGGSASGAVVPFTVTPAGVVQIRQTVGFFFGCNGQLTLNSIDLTLGAAGTLSGFGLGQATYLTADTATTGSASMAFAGTPDTTPPALGGSSTALDPFDAVTLHASEPLPPDAHPLLTGASGDQFPLSATSGQAIAAFSFPLPRTLLRFGETYHASLAGIPDFSGNVGRAADDFAFTTIAAPPLVAEDGFESATGTSLGGGQILSGAGAPTISGTTSLYVPLAATNVIYPLPSKVTQLALRLALNPGDSVLRFSYELVNPTLPMMTTFLLASVGGAITAPTLPAADKTPTTTATIPGTGTVTIGPVTTGELPLPPGASGEIVLELVIPGSTCPVLGVAQHAGFIIDDLRAE
jgi:hypothetical protein